MGVYGRKTDPAQVTMGDTGVTTVDNLGNTDVLVEIALILKYKIVNLITLQNTTNLYVSFFDPINSKVVVVGGLQVNDVVIFYL